MKIKYTVFQLDGTTVNDEKNEYFMSRCNQLKMVAFGNTREDAEIRIRQAVEIWKNALSGRKLLTRRLTELGIPFDVIEETESKSQTSEWHIDKVMVGA